MSNQPPTATRRSLTGYVTKLVGGADGSTYGFINDEIFFPQTNVSGGPASVGDQVFAECEYSENLPIKWNAKSLQIISKGGNQPRPNQQDMMNQSNQQQINMAQPVAVTYQQHRQQRQQRQMMDNNRQPDNSNMGKQQGSDLTSKLVEQTTQSGSEYFANNANIQPFQDQTPMGPPNFAFTSQLGSAFVQNQFVPPPFLTQQQQQPLLPQQQLLPSNNQPMSNNNNNNNNNSNNQGNNQRQNKGGNRFNNQGDKNDRQNNRRNRNDRNDNKFDRARSGDRDNQQNNRSKSSRDRSTGRNVKREEPPTRPSPPHSSARSTTSISSDRGHKGRRHYEIQNIPKTHIMTNMNAYNMKQRCPSSVHVPSDLKEIIVNKHFRLDIKNTPKPLMYSIEQMAKAEDPPKPDGGKDRVDGKSDVETQDDAATPQKAETQQPELTPSAELDIKKSEVKSDTSSPLKLDTKLSNKYGVKVVLISLPELATIYQNVFGANLDSFTSDAKPATRLDETISLLCNKGSNNGYSLIGGKFDAAADGFVDGQVNEFERHKLQPDLIATCKRVVLEQTGLDLSECKSWTLLSTFMYNNRSDYFTSKASIEYSFIYMPQIWTMLSDKIDKNLLEKESNEEQTKEINTVEEIKMETDQFTDAQVPQPDGETSDQSLGLVESVKDIIDPSIPENLNDLKVADLKSELDKRDIKYKGSAKKSELITLLQESIQQDPALEAIPNINVEVQLEDVKRLDTEMTSAVIADEEDANISTVATLGDESQLEEGEVEADPSEDSPIGDGDDVIDQQESGCKRKTSEVDGDSSITEPDTKKICSEASEHLKDKKVNLIQEAFIVRSRDDQQLSLVSLYDASQAARYDQFELSVASNLLKESLIQHLSEYMLTTLVENNLQKHMATGTLSNTSSQETGSDKNNNDNTANTKSTFKNPSSVTDQTASLKEYPVDRYINLAFSFFDVNHMGHIHTDDLNKLFNNTSLTISKRALTSLLGDSEKFNYRTLPDISPRLSPTYVYRFPEQFSCLPGSSTNSDDLSSGTVRSTGKMIEFRGVTYDVEKLIQQVNEAETLRVSLVDRFNYAIENSDKQAEEIHVLEVSQKSLGKAIKAQNDEICDLKRERDSYKKKYENVRKGIKGTISSLSELVKDDKQ